MKLRFNCKTPCFLWCLKLILICGFLFIQDQAILKYICTSLKELRDTADARNIDPEAYFRLVLLARGVAVARPQHLVTYTAPTPARPANGTYKKMTDVCKIETRTQKE